MSLWLHVVEENAGVDVRRVVHAVRFQKRQPRRRTVDAVCGRRVRYACLAAVDSDGQPAGHMALGWPPRLKALDEGETRCAECFEATGKPRPHPSWDKSERLVAVGASL